MVDDGVALRAELVDQTSYAQFVVGVAAFEGIDL